MTNKKLAFYVSLIAMTALLGLIISGHITNEQAALIIPPLLMVCGVFMGLDALYDFLNIAFRVGDKVVALTPSTEDDERLADLKALVEQLQDRAKNDEPAIGGLVLEWLDKNWRLLPDLFIPKNDIDSKNVPTVTTTTTVTPFTTEIAGTSHSFPTVADDKIAG